MSFSFFKRAACHHDYKVTHKVVEGATLSWAMKPTRQFSFYLECAKCGKGKVERGMIMPRDQKRHPDLYDESGWPLDEEGNRLEIA